MTPKRSLSREAVLADGSGKDRYQIRDELRAKAVTFGDSKVLYVRLGDVLPYLDQQQAKTKEQQAEPVDIEKFKAEWEARYKGIPKEQQAESVNKDKVINTLEQQAEHDNDMISQQRIMRDEAECRQSKLTMLETTASRARWMSNAKLCKDEYSRTASRGGGLVRVRGLPLDETGRYARIACEDKSLLPLANESDIVYSRVIAGHKTVQSLDA